MQDHTQEQRISDFPVSCFPKVVMATKRTGAKPAAGPLIVTYEPPRKG